MQPIARIKQKREWLVKLFCAAGLLLYPFVFWLALLFDTPDVLGVNVGILVVLLLLSVSAMFSGLYIDRKLFLLAVVACTGALLSATTRVAVLDELSNVRYLLMPFFYMIIALSICRRIDPGFVITVIWASVLLQAIIGIIHNLYFPHIIVGYDLDNDGILFHILPPDEGGFRENGTLLGPNVFANFLTIGVALISFVGRRSSDLRSRLLAGLSGLILIYAIFLSGSRLGMAFAVLFIALAGVTLIAKYHRKGIVVLLGMMCIPLVIFAALPILNQLISRTVSEGSGGRLEKLQLSFGLLEKKFESLMIGVSNADVTSAMSVNGVTISDNSFTLLWLDNGLMAVILFPVIFAIGILRILPTSVRPIWALYFVSAFLLNNAILWDIWWCFLLFSTCALSEFAAKTRRERNVGFSHYANV